MSSNIFYGAVLVTLGAVMWGIDASLLTNSYFSKFQFYNIPFIVFIAHAIPSVFLSIFCFKDLKALFNSSKKDILFIFLNALFGGVLGTLCIVKALSLTGYDQFSIVVLIQKLQPVFSIIIATVLLKERPKAIFYIVAIIALISSYLIAFGLTNPFNINYSDFKSILYSLFAAIFFGASTILSKKVSNKYSFKASTYYRFLITAIIMLFILLSQKGLVPGINAFRSNYNLLFLALTIAVWGMIALIIYYKGMTKTSASVATFCELAFPLTALVLQSVINLSIPSTIQIVGILLLLGSIVYLNLNSQKLLKS